MHYLDAFRKTLPDTLAELQALEIAYDVFLTSLLKIGSCKTFYVDITAHQVNDSQVNSETIILRAPGMPSEFRDFCMAYANRTAAEIYVIQDKIDDLLPDRLKHLYE